MWSPSIIESSNDELELQRSKEGFVVPEGTKLVGALTLKTEISLIDNRRCPIRFSQRMHTETYVGNNVVRHTWWTQELDCFFPVRDQGDVPSHNIIIDS